MSANPTSREVDPSSCDIGQPHLHSPAYPTLGTTGRCWLVPVSGRNVYQDDTILEGYDEDMDAVGDDDDGVGAESTITQRAAKEPAVGKVPAKAA
ncbi:hypothetical protein M404DRAFT_35785 [Pisolithus tinctorius Marx 270]|uniref:Uncharacterized protein n=1 Tax=Pisolithus tinctorius Marx 270 TaxID=870435 RepID=A0A0C3J7S3_PISTI|nr:hypothetical protein M404DRAFT_35785 [Pisolithus tinctorius Marx 270]